MRETGVDCSGVKCPLAFPYSCRSNSNRFLRLRYLKLEDSFLRIGVNHSDAVLACRDKYRPQIVGNVDDEKEALRHIRVGAVGVLLDNPRFFETLVIFRRRLELIEGDVDVVRGALLAW